MCTGGKEGPRQLCNFTAEIVRQLIYHEGATKKTVLIIRGEIKGEELPEIEVTAAEFPNMGWVADQWGMAPVIYAEGSAERHIRAAMQCESTPETIHVYTSTGWTVVEEEEAYVTMGGAIRVKDYIQGVTVRLPQELALYSLPEPTQDAASYRASLDLASLGSPGVCIPMLVATYRAAMGSADFAIHLAGRTGTFKSELSSLMQSHYGEQMDARHLPASWSSTANALEALSYKAKDAAMVIDDFVPTGTAWQVRQLQKTADQILRGQGNQAGRSRLTDMSSLQTTMYPRGIILSTGEDIPEQQSIRARMLILELTPGEIKPDALSRAQANRQLYPYAMADWIRWMMESSIRSTHAADAATYRDQYLDTGHTRTPPILGELIATVHAIANWGLSRDYVTAEEVNNFRKHAVEACVFAATQQDQYLLSADPIEGLIETIKQVMGGYLAHAKTKSGGVPEASEACGWTVQKSAGSVPSYKSNGPRIAWIDTDAGEFLLDPAAMPLLKKHGGMKLAISTPTLLKRLKESGMMTRVDDARQRLTIRSTIEGHPRNVLAISLGEIIEEDENPASDTF